MVVIFGSNDWSWINVCGALLNKSHWSRRCILFQMNALRCVVAYLDAQSDQSTNALSDHKCVVVAGRADRMYTLRDVGTGM